jgi:hypothetical protein
VLCRRPARVRPERAGEGAEGFATVRDLSVAGVGLHLDEPCPPGTVLVIEPLAGGARALLARVVRVAEEGEGWLHGCVLSNRLSVEELAGWVGQSAGTAPG